MSDIKALTSYFYIYRPTHRRTCLKAYSGFGWYKTILALYTEIHLYNKTQKRTLESIITKKTGLNILFGNIQSCFLLYFNKILF